MTRYIGVVEAAKLMRRALAAKFPGTKFSVRTKKYAGGSSIDISYRDGPVYKDVNDLCRMYQGARFDGMIDMQFNVNHWLEPDGSVSLASSPGSSGSMGTYDPFNNPAPSPQAEKVSFGSSYVSVSRKFSKAVLAAAVEAVGKEHGHELVVEICEYSDGDAYLKDGWKIQVPAGGEDLQRLVNQHLSELSIAAA